MRSRRLFIGAMLVALLPGLVTAAERRKAGEFNPDDQSVEFFQAMADGTLSVKFIPQDAKAANILIENKTDKPLNVQLPAAFAGVPVLAQFGAGQNPFGGGQQQQGGGGGGGAQGLGGGGDQQGGGNNPGFFNVAPEKVGIVKVATVCLDHGKPDPTPRMEYKIVPAEEYVKRPAVIELLKVFGQGKVDREAAQAATWHLNNDMSWKELANKRIFSRKYAGGSKAYFQRNALKIGYRLALYSKEQAKDAPSTESAVSQSSSPGTVSASPVRSTAAAKR